MKGKRHYAILFFCLIFFSATICYGRNYKNAIEHQVQKHDQVTYKGKIVSVESTGISVEIYGPGCNGLSQFKRDTWRPQVSYGAGDTITFVLSGECFDENSVLTVESKR